MKPMALWWRSTLLGHRTFWMDPPFSAAQLSVAICIVRIYRRFYSIMYAANNISTSTVPYKITTYGTCTLELGIAGNTYTYYCGNTYSNQWVLRRCCNTYSRAIPTPIGKQQPRKWRRPWFSFSLRPLFLIHTNFCKNPPVLHVFTKVVCSFVAFQTTGMSFLGIFGTPPPRICLFLAPNSYWVTIVTIAIVILRGWKCWQ